jgi:hypothetical protein
MSLSKSETNRVAIPVGRLLLKKAISRAISKNSAGDKRAARSSQGISLLAIVRARRIRLPIC